MHRTTVTCLHCTLIRKIWLWVDIVLTLHFSNNQWIIQSEIVLCLHKKICTNVVGAYPPSISQPLLYINLSMWRKLRKYEHDLGKEAKGPGPLINLGILAPPYSVYSWDSESALLFYTAYVLCKSIMIGLKDEISLIEGYLKKEDSIIFTCFKFYDPFHPTYQPVGNGKKFCLPGYWRLLFFFQVQTKISSLQV